MNVLEVKAAVRKRDGYCCTACGMTRAEHFAKYEHDLDVHRTTPGSEYTVEGCVTRCRVCHGPEPKRARGEACRVDGLMLRLHPDFWQQLDQLVDLNKSDYTEEIRQALRERFERCGLWPPKPSTKGKKPPPAKPPE